MDDSINSDRKLMDKLAASDSKLSPLPNSSSQTLGLRKYPRQSESLLRETLEASFGAILVVDTAGKVITYNQTFVEMWCIPDSFLETNQDQNALKFVLKLLKDPDAFLKRVYELYSQPEAESYDELEFKDGRILKRYSKPYRLDGRIAGRVWSFLDVSEQKRAEELLLKRFDALQAIYQLSDTVFRAGAIEEIYRKAIEGILRTLNADRAAILVRDEHGVMRFKASHGLSATYRKAVDRQSPWPHEARGPNPIFINNVYENGQLMSWRPVFKAEGIEAVAFIPLVTQHRLVGKLEVLYNQPHHFDDNEIQLCQTISRHIAFALERKQSELELQKSEERYRILFQNNPTMYFTVDEEGIVTSVNEFGLSQLGYAEHELVGKSVLTVFHEDDRDDLFKQLRGCLVDLGAVKRWEFRKICKNGKVMWVQEYARAIKYPDGRYRVLIVCEDITERRRLLGELARSQRLETAGFVAGTIAHDFNNLLSALTAYPSLIRDSLDSHHPAHDLLDEMEFSARQIAEINQQLLSLGRRGHYSMEPLQLNDLVSKVATSLSLPDEVTIQKEFSADLFLIEGGPAQLTRALSNLILNAKEAMGGKGSLTFKTENIYLDEPLKGYNTVNIGEYVKLVIRDSGSGIAPGVIDKIFDPFFTTKRMDRQRGSGLGLSIVHSIIEDHKGYITVESVAGKGTAVSLYFPIHRNKKLTESPLTVRGGEEKIMVVDDDAAQRLVVSRILKHLGYSVHLACSGEQAVAHLQKNPCDLLILDMVMDGMDGTETYLQILKSRPQQKAIVMSGFAMSDRVKKALQLGASGFISKPVSLKPLALAVRQALDKNEIALATSA